MDDITTLLLIGGLLLAVSLLMLRQNRLYRQWLSDSQQQIDIINTNINALCAGAVGVDQRLSLLENQGREVQHRVTSVETRRQAERPYGEAIQMVHRGATCHRLVEELGLSHSEANLVVMLHGMKKAG